MNNTLIIVCIVAIVGIIAIVAMTWGATTSTPKNKIDTPIVSVDNESAAADKSSADEIISEPTPDNPVFTNAYEHIKWMADTKNVSPWGLRKNMEQYNYTEEEIEQAIADCNIDWEAEAIGVANDYYMAGITTYQELHDQLTAEGFTADQASAALLATELFD